MVSAFQASLFNRETEAYMCAAQMSGRQCLRASSSAAQRGPQSRREIQKCLSHLEGSREVGGQCRLSWVGNSEMVGTSHSPGAL